MSTKFIDRASQGNCREEKDGTTLDLQYRMIEFTAGSTTKGTMQHITCENKHS